MPALTDLPEIIGFFSYSREDDEDASNSLSTLRTRIQNELRARLGRSRSELRLWQDQEAIAPGTMWESQIELAVKQSVFFVPIITPRVINSKYCGIEFQRFLDRERELGRNDLVFPILYIDVGELEDEKLWRQHPVLKEIGSRQYVDWREYRYEADSPALRRAVATFSAKIVAALQRSLPDSRASAVPAGPAKVENPALDETEERLRREQAEKVRQREDADRRRIQEEAASRERAEVERLKEDEDQKRRQVQEDERKRDEERRREILEQVTRVTALQVEKPPLQTALEWGVVGAVSMVISWFIAYAMNN